MDWFKGKKTYIMMIITGALGIAVSMGVILPDWVWAVDAALFGGALRNGMK